MAPQWGGPSRFVPNRTVGGPAPRLGSRATGSVRGTPRLVGAGVTGLVDRVRSSGSRDQLTADSSLRLQQQRELARLAPLFHTLGWPVGDGATPPPIGNAFHQPGVTTGMAVGWSYWHGGIDILSRAGTPVASVLGGFVHLSVTNQNGTAEVVLGIYNPEHNLLIDYGHLDPRSVPAAIRRAASSRERIDAGAPLGRIAPFGVSSFDHLHLTMAVPPAGVDLVGKAISSMAEYDDLVMSRSILLNPELFFSCEDRLPPEIRELLLTDNRGRALSPDQPCSGTVHLLADIADSRPSAPDIRLPPISVSYAVESLEGGPHSIAKTTLWDFSTLPTQNIGDEQRLNRIYLIDPRGPKTSWGPQMMPGEQPNRFYFRVTNSMTQGALDGWSTDALGSNGLPRFPDGRYRITVFAADVAGNESRRSLVVRVQNTRR